jgi:hypothetical protein
VKFGETQRFKRFNQTAYRAMPVSDSCSSPGLWARLLPLTLFTLSTHLLFPFLASFSILSHSPLVVPSPPLLAPTGLLKLLSRSACIASPALPRWRAALSTALFAAPEAPRSYPRMSGHWVQHLGRQRGFMGQHGSLSLSLGRPADGGTSSYSVEPELEGNASSVIQAYLH